ncbi:MAG: YfiT family bacillithiol transferase [Bacteroidota bacterium]
MMLDLEQLRYPVGEYIIPDLISPTLRDQWIAVIADLPGQLKQRIEGLSPEQLDTPYRPGGWTLRQLIHHLADSHMNSYIRFKLGLTEDRAAIRPYDESRWAELPDTPNTPVQVSLNLLDNLHQRWVVLLQQMKDSDWERTVYHPENKQTYRLDELLGMYDWHSRHHLAHIEQTFAQNGW